MTQSRNRLNIAVLWMMKYDGSGWLTGGLERWCRDIALHASEQGYEVHIYQKAQKKFEENLSGSVIVHGIEASLDFKGNLKLSRWLSSNLNPSNPVLFVSQELAIFCNFPKTVLVNHGIWWDGDLPIYKRLVNKRLQYRLIRKSSKTICVDTNYINWCHAELPNRKSWQEKLCYIPNYADTNLFESASQGTNENRDSFRLLFPRRLMGSSIEDDPRGAGLFLRAIEVLRSKGHEPRVEFLGRGELQDQVLEWAKSQGWSDRITIGEVEMDKMPETYKSADVVVIPTLAHEGTSLSAIESMVMGKSTVVTHIGGLCNIAIDGFNAHVSDLNPDSLADAILRAKETNYLSDQSVLEAFRNSLSKGRWQKAVWEVLKS